MPENQEAGKTAPEWTQESFEKQAAEAAPEVKEEAAPEKPAEIEKEKVEKVVPLGALHEERAKRREESARRQELERRVEELQRQQLEILARRQPAEVVPDLATQPLEHFAHNQQKTAAEVAKLREDQQRIQQQQAERQRFDGFVMAVKAQEAEFVKEQPDALDGIGFLKTARIEQYEAGGLSKGEATQRMLRDEWELVSWAMQNGENPAKAAYEMARKSGYVPATKKLEMQKEGQGASMPTAGGRSGGSPSLDTLLKMDSKDFAKATEGDNWARLMKKHM